MTQDYAASVQGVAVRVCRLNTDGTPATGTDAAYELQNFTVVEFTPEYENGDEYLTKSASGALCVNYLAQNVLKRVTMSVSICEPDPEFTEIIAGGTLLTDDSDPTKTVGYAPEVAGTIAVPNGVGLEVWSNAITNGGRANNNPYFRWVFPRIFMQPSGNRQIQNGVMAITFEGYGNGNSNFGTGPGGDWNYISDRPYVYARESTTPPSSAGYVSV